MENLASAKTATEVAASAAVLGCFYYYVPKYFQLAGIAVCISWAAYLTSVYLNSNKKPVLNPNEWKNFTLIEKTRISHNVALYRFALPKSDDVLGLPVGQHISVQAEINGKLVQRSYTPTSSNDDRGHFDLVIKSYANGLISKYVGELKIGDQITVRGPKGQFKYTPGMVKAFGMIAGGTGITPMLQVIRYILKNPSDRTQVSLIFANVTYDDILLKDELDALAAGHENFSVHYTLDKPPSDWNGGVGFVTADMIKEYCPPPDPNIKILICGPGPMVSFMAKHCEALGYEKARNISKLPDQVFKF